MSVDILSTLLIQYVRFKVGVAKLHLKKNYTKKLQRCSLVIAVNQSAFDSLLFCTVCGEN